MSGGTKASFAGRRALITGGSSGIGRALALGLVDAGAHVAIAARGQGGLDATLAELRARARPEQRVLAVAVDVADHAAVEAAVARVVEALDGIDLLINNAGITHPATLLDTPIAVLESIMRVNYFGTVHVTRAALPTMLAGPRPAQIAMVSSLAGIIGIYGYTGYAASKFALVGFAEALRQELLSEGVGVSVVLPPDTDTPMLAAENRIKPAQTHAVAGNVAVMSAERVAAATLAGLRRGRAVIIPGFGSRLSAFAIRRFPGLTRWVLDAQLRRFERKRLAGGGT